MSDLALYLIATMVMDGVESVTSNDCRMVYEAGFVNWEGDCDGVRPVPTDKYIELMDKFSPIDQRREN